MTAGRRWRLATLVFATAAGAYALDRVTKALAEHLLQANPVKLIPRVLELTFTTNRGGAFGLFGNAPYLFLAATLVVCAAIVVASFGVSRPVIAVGMGLVLGGALGNLTDRIVRGTGLRGLAGIPRRRTLAEGVSLVRPLLGRLATADGVSPDLPELQLRVGVRARELGPVDRFTREIAPLILNGPPSVTGFAGGRPKPEEIVAYWPALIDKREVQPCVDVVAV